MTNPDPPAPHPEASAPPPPPAAAGAKPAAPPTAPAAAKVEAPKPAPPAKAPAPAAEAKPAAAPAKPAPAPAGVGVTHAPKDGPTGVVVLDAKSLAMIVSALCVLVMVFGGSTLFLLLRQPPVVYQVTDQLPGMDGPGKLARPAGGGPASAGAAATPEADKPKEAPQDVKLGEFFQKGEGVPSKIPGSWPMFRGAKRDNIVHGGAKLADSWPASGPPVLWTVKVADGYAGAAIHDGRVYLMDHDIENKRDVLRCLSLDDGREIWRRGYGVKITQYHGYSRAVPAVDDRYAVTMGAYCHVMCVDAKTGDFKWGFDFMKDFGTQLPTWYTSQCPLIDGDQAVLAPGGTEILMMGVDLETGKILWKTPNPKKWNICYSSVMPMTFGGRKMYVYSAPEGTLAAAADGANPGEVLWSSEDWGAKHMSPSPFVLPDGKVYLSSGYNAGSAMLQISESGGRFEAKTLWVRKEAKDGPACEQQTPVLHEGRMFLVHPKDGGALKEQFLSVTADTAAKVVWSSGKDKRFGLGPYILADGKFYILDDGGRLTMCRASVDKWEELGSFEVFTKGKEAWGPLAVVGTRMVLRDYYHLSCIDLGKGSSQ